MRSKVGFVGIGQAGGNIVELFSKKGYRTLAINSSEEDLGVLSVENKYIIPEAEGCSHNRKKAIKYAKENYLDILGKIDEVMVGVEIIYLVYSAGGGTGSGIGVVMTDILSQVYGGKVVGAVCVLPSRSEAPNVQVNAYECFTELSQLDHIGGVFILDNDKDDKFIVNKRFVDLFDGVINITKHVSKKGNIDKSEVFQALSVRGCVVITSAENPGKLVTSLGGGIFPDIESDKQVVYMLVSLSGDIEANTLGDKFGVPLDMFINYNEMNKSLLVLCGLSFFRTRLKGIKDVIDGSKKRVAESVNNAFTDKLENTLSWGINLGKKEKSKVDFESIFEKY